MSIRLVVTRGFGNGTFSGSIKDVVLRGYSIGAALILIGKQSNCAFIKFQDTRSFVEFQDTRAFIEFQDTRGILKD